MTLDFQVVDEEWLIIETDDVTWRVDADFLGSNWRCVWDAGCVGIETAPAPEAGLGCCSVGAQMLDDDEARLISALGASIAPERMQFADEAARGGVLDADHRNTRVIDGACIFLNRPGFAGGHGCALHLEAVASGDQPIDVKPSVCWQLPLKVERVASAEGEVATLRRWRRDDWGPEGHDMAWCCTETDMAVADAYVGEVPVVVSLGDEIAALVGPEVAADLATRLGR